MSLELNNNPVLNKVRDIFLFSCYTGLRFNDAQNLDDSSLMEINGNTYLRIDQGKTGERIEIPLLDPAKKLLLNIESALNELIKESCFQFYQIKKLINI